MAMGVPFARTWAYVVYSKYLKMLSARTGTRTERSESVGVFIHVANQHLLKACNVICQCGTDGYMES